MFQCLKESFKLYSAINDGIINLVDKVKASLVCISLRHRYVGYLTTTHTKDSIDRFITCSVILQFFEMTRHDAIQALEIYKRATLQVFH